MLTGVREDIGAIRAAFLATLTLLLFGADDGAAIGGHPTAFGAPVWSADSGSVVLVEATGPQTARIDRVAVATGRRVTVIEHTDGSAPAVSVTATGAVAAIGFDSAGFRAAMVVDSAGRTRTLARVSPQSTVAWSPDGSRLAFTDAHGQLSTSRPDGSALVPLTAGSGATWSPDGSRIAFLDGAGVGIVPSTGGRVEHVADGGRRVAWSPDGARLLITDATALRVLTLATGTTVTIDGVAAAWSPDGAQLAVARGGRLFVVSHTGADARVISARTDAGSDVAWSSDGAWIAYVALNATPSGQVYQQGHATDVRVVHPDGAGRRSLTGGCAVGPATPDDWLCLVNGRVAVPARIALRPQLFLGSPTPAGRSTRIAVFAEWQGHPVYGAGVRLGEISGPSRLRFTLRLPGVRTDVGGRIAFVIAMPYRHGRYVLRAQTIGVRRALAVRL